LGKFQLSGIPPAPRGIPQIEVTYDIDANGIISVSAKDLGTGKEQKITITATNKLSKDEISKMVHQAEQFSEEDKKRKEKVEALNQADTLIYTTEKTLIELGDKVTAEEREKVQKASEEVKAAMKTDDVAAIKAKVDALMKEMSAVSTRIYQAAAAQQQAQQAQQPQQEAPPPGDGKKDQGGKGDFTDADYHIVD
jgi:molecular chaperone DnaK